MLKQLWHDEHGAVISTDACIVGVVLVVGLIAGIASVQSALVGELADVSDAIEEFDFTPNPITEDDELDDLSSQGNAPLTAADVLD